MTSGQNEHLFKIAVMASGPVGRATVQTLARHYYAEDLTAVVLDDGESWTAFGPIADLPIEHLCLTWSDVTSRPRILCNFDLDVLLLAWWPHINGADLIASAKCVLNFHPSLLPHCRGKDPNFWSIRDGKPFGVTINHVRAELDAGPIAFQQELPYNLSDTGGSFYDRALSAMTELIERSYPDIRTGRIPAISQDERLASFHRRAEFDPACKLSLYKTMNVRELIDLLRAKTFPRTPDALSLRTE